VPQIGFVPPSPWKDLSWRTCLYLTSLVCFVRSTELITVPEQFGTVSHFFVYFFVVRHSSLLAQECNASMCAVLPVWRAVMEWSRKCARTTWRGTRRWPLGCKCAKAKKNLMSLIQCWAAIRTLFLNWYKTHGAWHHLWTVPKPKISDFFNYVAQTHIFHCGCLTKLFREMNYQLNCFIRSTW